MQSRVFAQDVDSMENMRTKRRDSNLDWRESSVESVGHCQRVGKDCIRICPSGVFSALQGLLVANSSSRKTPCRRLPLWAHRGELLMAKPGQGYACAATVTGRVNRKVAPRPESPMNHRRPPCDSIIERLMG